MAARRRCSAALRLWLWCAFLLPVFAIPLFAAPLRITTWNLQPDSLVTNGFSKKYQQSMVGDAAEALKKIDPDIILLQQVADWDTCNELIKALKPLNYNLGVCSSFRDPHSGTLSRQQVAILSKTRPFISWSERWEDNKEPAAPGGFAFAAIKVDGKNLGIYSVQMSDPAAPSLDDSSTTARQLARDASAQQLIQQFASLRNWNTNRIQSLLVAGDFSTSADDPRFANEKTLARLEQFGLADAFAGLPLEKRATLPGKGDLPDAVVDYIFTRDVSLVENRQVLPEEHFEHWPATCEFELNAAKVEPAPAQITRAQLPAAKPEAGPASHAPAQSLAAANAKAVGNSWKLLWLAGIVAGAFALLAMARRVHRRKQLQSVGTVMRAIQSETGAIISIPNAERGMISSAPVRPAGVSPEAVREGVIAQMSAWLKEKFTRRLLSDRAQLLATQEEAALRVLAVDERLTKVERQIQRRNSEYEQRIDELLKELAVTREENRELIRAKIALIKIEMEKERLKAEQYARNQRLD